MSADIWQSWILPYLAGRARAMRRCKDGTRPDAGRLGHYRHAIEGMGDVDRKDYIALAAMHVTGSDWVMAFAPWLTAVGTFDGGVSRLVKLDTEQGREGVDGVILTLKNRWRPSLIAVWTLDLASTFPFRAICGI